MTVKELIECLEKFDPELEILMHDGDFDALAPIFRVEVWELRVSERFKNKEYVVLE